MGGVILIIALSLFYFFGNRQHPEKWSVSFKNFFRKCECIRSCYLLISSNILKKSFRKTSLFLLTVTGVFLEESVVSCIFQTIVKVMIKTLEKYRWRSSVLERNFRNTLLVYLSMILTTNSRTLFLKNSPTSRVWFL